MEILVVNNKLNKDTGDPLDKDNHWQFFVETMKLQYPKLKSIKRSSEYEDVVYGYDVLVNTNATREWFYQVKSTEFKSRFKSRLKIHLIERNEKGNLAGFGRYFQDKIIDVFCFQFPESNYSLQILYEPMKEIWNNKKHMTKHQNGKNIYYSIKVVDLLSLLPTSKYSEIRL